MKYILPLVAALLLIPHTGLFALDVILEFKGAYFYPTSEHFRSIYHTGGALYGPELTVQLYEDSCWYGFGSFDYFQKKGKSIGLCDPTRITLIPLGLGIKYIRPLSPSCVDGYLGLGFQAVDVMTKNCSQGVTFKQSQWGFGGIAKAGLYWHLPHQFVLDFFIDYSFVWAGDNKNCCQNPDGLQSIKADISGAIFGVGLGYQF